MSSRKARLARQQTAVATNGEPTPATQRARRRTVKGPALPGILLVALLLLGIVGITVVTAARRTPTSAAAVATAPQPIAKSAQVLIYVPDGQPAWQPQTLARVGRETEFQYEGRLFYIDVNGTQWRRENVNVQVLAETDRVFDPANWRFPESGDVVRFVDSGGRHRFHQVMDRMAADDRFWFQGVLYAVFSNPQNPQQLGYQPAGRVLDADGQAVSTAEYVARHGGADAIAQAQAPNNPNYNPAFAAAVAANTNGAPEQLGLMPRLNASPAAAVAAPPPAPSGASAGATAPAAGSGLPTDYLFTGQKWDSATGLYKMGDRYYDPVLGHFISPDPLIPDPSDPQQLNRYSYAGNNPLKYTDPTGHCMELGISPIPCSLVLQRVAERGPSIWQQIQSLAVQYSPQLTQMGEQVSHVVAQQLAKANSSSSASPGGLDPNKWDPKRLGFKSGSSLRAHFEKHVLERADEAWHELFGLSREELAARAADPNQMAGLQNTYMQWGQKASNAGNFIGVQAEGQQVFVDTSTKVTAILQGDKFVSLYRITMWQQFELSMLDKGLKLASGVTLEALKKAMGF